MFRAVKELSHSALTRDNCSCKRSPSQSSLSSFDKKEKNETNRTFFCIIFKNMRFLSIMSRADYMGTPREEGLELCIE